MASHRARVTFRWPSTSPSEVFVTGTFDNWSKSIQLARSEAGFEKQVELSVDGSAIFYKFVVDDVWKTDPAAPLETDEHNNLNNVLSSAALSDMTVPSIIPDPTKAEEAEAVYSVNPFPASSGPGNPITLKEGEAVPDPSGLANAFNSQVTLDKESYENSSKWAEDAIAELEAKRAAAATAATTTSVDAAAADSSAVAKSIEPASEPAAAPAIAPVSVEEPAASSKSTAAPDDAKVTPASEPVAAVSAVADTPTAAPTTDVSEPAATATAATVLEPVSDSAPLASSAVPAGEVEGQYFVNPIAASTGNRPPSDIGVEAADRDVTLSKEEYDNFTDTRAEAEMARIQAEQVAKADSEVPAAVAGTEAPVVTEPEQTATAVPEPAVAEPATAGVPTDADKGAPVVPKEDEAVQVPTTEFPASKGLVSAEGIAPLLWQSAGPETSTAALAADAPIKPREPSIVVSKVDESVVESTTEPAAAASQPEGSAAKAVPEPSKLSEAAAKTADGGSKISEDRVSATSSDKDKKKRRRSMIGWLKNLIQH